MADMTFKANLLPVSDLGKNLGASNQRWKVYGDLYGNATTASALNPIASIGSSSTSHDVALKNYFSSYNSSIPRNKLISFYDNSNSNGSIAFGYFLDGYNSNPYGGFFVSHYNTPYYVGIQNGTYSNQTILTNTNYASYLDDRYVNVTGDTMTGTLYINNTTDVGLNQNGALVIGNKTGYNIGIDGDEIAARNNSVASTLYLNNDGGAVQAKWLQVINNSSNNANDAMVYLENKNNNDWAQKILLSTYNYGLYISGTGTNLLKVGDNNTLYIGNGDAQVNGSILKITNNSNTLSIGSQNSTYTHIYNSADIPFIFNKDVNVTDKHWLGSTSYPWGGLRLGGSGEIQYQGTKANYTMIKMIDNTGDNYGNGIRIGGGGATIIGGGESAIAAAAQVTGGSEVMYVCNDGDVNIISNLDGGWNNRKTMTLNTHGYLMLPSYINVPTGNNENPTISQFIVTNGSDHYYRKASTAHTMAAIRSAASGSWGINITGSAASATKASQDDGGYNINGWYAKEHIDIIDCSSLNVNTWYPAVIELPIDGMHLVGVVNELNGGVKPAWASHDSGYTCCVELLVTRSGWGTTNRYTILLQNDQRFITDMNVPPVGYNQFTNSSRACFYLRGGGKYRVRNTWKGTWTLYTSSTTVSSQTIAPVTSYPGMSGIDIQLLDRDKYSRFVRAYGAVWNDYAEMRRVDESIDPGRCVHEIGNGKMVLSTERLERGCKVISDTYGFNIGETEECKTPIAVSGRVLVYLYEGREYAKSHIGWPVCSGPDGTVSVMSEEEEIRYPSRIIGTISEIPEYETWGTGNVQVNDRIWIYVR